MLAQEQKKNADAEKLFKRSQAIEEKRQGRDHPIVAQVVSNLGTLYQSQGRYAEAEKAFQRALDIRQTAFGSNNTDTAVSLSQLGALAHERGRSAEAESLLKKALEIRQKALSADHPDLVLSQNNLATLYAERGKYADAELLFHKALESRERTLGPNDLKVAAVLYNLARMYKDQAKADKNPKGNLERAAADGQRALTIRKESAPGSLELAASQELMARVHAARLQAGIDKTMNEAAVDYLKSALAIREKVQGRDHRDLGITAHQLGNALRDRDKPKDAEPYYKQALALAEKYYGTQHVNVAAVLEDYASLLEKTKDPSAQRLRDRAKEIRAKSAKKAAATNTK
jgi:tetratricopeptide (TPR) repeat protein